VGDPSVARVYRPGPVRDTTEPRAASSGAARTWPLVLLLGACALAFMAVAGLSPRPAGGELAQAGEAVIGVSGETVPGKLPRSRMVPAALRLGFTSEAPSTPTTPELTAIRLEVSPQSRISYSGPAELPHLGAVLHLGREADMRGVAGRLRYCSLRSDPSRTSARDD